MSQSADPAAEGAAREVALPLDPDVVRSLHAGDRVTLTGSALAARDAAHQRMHDLLAAGEPLPCSLAGETIYYVGPSPARPGEVIGSAGPTSSYRMDSYTPELLALGLRGMIGKGRRSRAVIEAIKQHQAVYFGAVGGAGALLARRITRVDPVAWEDLGAEAIVRLWLDHFPVVVINDADGRDLYDEISGPGEADE
ncbi:MAG TPA: FumA C-terminus/TtdB family hydratase beta subunit [Ktedonobacterales bacterium]|jgi:fumarate hydratase subunit beta|nr:FumA C-terminus/TtdB family hydratase beta subunit [Ktedonobacterales bacterium]